MKTTGMATFIISLVVAGALIAPRLGTTNPMVDSTGCLACHEVGQFGAQDGSVHGTHSNCVDCHEGGTPQAGNVPASSCLACHPVVDSDVCDLADFHEESSGYDPAGASCYTCHPSCEGGNGGTTTTTTGPSSSINDTRWEVFIVGNFQEGCKTATLHFRSDNVFVMDCPDGFGSYGALGGVFTATFWSNNLYTGYNLGMFLSGIAVGPYITIIGVAYSGNIISPVLLVGYML